MKSEAALFRGGLFQESAVSADIQTGLSLDFVERQRTPEWAMKLGIRLRLAGLSLSNTVSVLEDMGVRRSRKAIHHWAQKVELQPPGGRNPTHVMVNKTVI
jgi:putative transposase